MAASWCRSAGVIVALLLAGSASAQVSDRDREEILALAEARGVAAADVAPMIQEVDRASASGLPSATLVNKIKEGLSKGYPPPVVQRVLGDLARHLGQARALLGGSGSEASRAEAMVVLAEALGRGVTQTEFDEIRRLAEEGGPTRTPAGLAQGAKFWALLKEAGYSADVLPLVADTIRQDFEASDTMALAREMAARRDDLAAPQRIEELRDGVRRGERPDRLLPPRDARDATDRPRGERPAPERPERERPQRDRP